MFDGGLCGLPLTLSMQAQAGYAGAALIVTGLVGAGVTGYILDRTKRFILMMRVLLAAGVGLITAVWCTHVALVA